MKLVFVLVDALRSSYLTEENMPFLYFLSKNNRYIEKIYPSPGFCERSEIFTGLDIFETGNFLAIGYDPSRSVYHNDKTLLSVMSLASGFSKRVVKRFFEIWRRKAKRTLRPYLIPYKSLSNFVLTEDGEYEYVKCRTIEDSLKEEGKSYSMDFFTSLADITTRSNLSITEFLESSIKKNQYFIPLYYGNIDTKGHHFANSIEAMRPYLKEADELLSSLYNMAYKAGYAFAVLGDHGMVPVYENVDIKQKIGELPLKIGKDYEMFLDSTMARFWFFNKNSAELISRIVESDFSSFGKVVSENEVVKYRLPMDIFSGNGRPLYGDLLWCANPGVLISPDYFHSANAEIKGMHGYLNTDSETGTGLFITTGCKIEHKSSSKLHEVCEELCNILGIPMPNINWKREI